MKLSALKAHLSELNSLQFSLPNGNQVPAHFHVTEIGLIDKKFIDCGGTIRHKQRISMQLWEAEDFEHRLKPTKLLGIIRKADRLLDFPDLTVEIEYQSDTIGRYELEIDSGVFCLKPLMTACLAEDKCGIESKPKVALASIGNAQEDNTCVPGSGCC